MFDPTTLTGIHTWLSLIAIAAGLVVVAGLLSSDGAVWGWVALFLAAALATSVTGFLLPFTQILPSHVTGVVALVVLAPTILAWAFPAGQGRRRVFVVGSVISLYLLALAGLTQLFAKIPALRETAPTQSEPSFVAAQLAVLAAFGWVGFTAARGVGR